jgi:hypothetical protein
MYYQTIHVTLRQTFSVQVHRAAPVRGPRFKLRPPIAGSILAGGKKRLPQPFTAA